MAAVVVVVVVGVAAEDVRLVVLALVAVVLFEFADVEEAVVVVFAVGELGFVALVVALSVAVEPRPFITRIDLYKSRVCHHTCVNSNFLYHFQKCIRVIKKVKKKKNFYM